MMKRPRGEISGHSTRERKDPQLTNKKLYAKLEQFRL